MNTFKRTNWTTEEVIELIKGQKIVNSDGEEYEYCKQHNEVVDHIADHFYDFIRPVLEECPVQKRILQKIEEAQKFLVDN